MDLREWEGGVYLLLARDVSTKDVRWMDSILSRDGFREWSCRYIARGCIPTGTGLTKTVSLRGVKGGLALLVYRKISIDEMRNQVRPPILIIQTCLLDQQESVQLNRSACRYRSTIQYNRVV